MGKTWVLDTSTKGTGATMVPLEKTLRKSSEHSEPVFVAPAPRSEPDVDVVPEPRRPRLFKVVDISTRQTLTEGADAAATIEALNRVRSIVDVNVYVWQPETEKWRLLTFHERHLLWDARAGPAARSRTDEPAV